LDVWILLVFSGSKDRQAESLKDLVAILQATHGSVPEVAGNLFSSWDTPALYLDSWEDNHSPADPKQAISTSLDAETIQTLKEFSDQCNWEGKNPGLDKTYKDNILAQTRFAKKEVETGIWLFGVAIRDSEGGFAWPLRPFDNSFDACAWKRKSSFAVYGWLRNAKGAK
jgi:hypothetical protein